MTLKNYLKSLCWPFLIGLAIFSLLCAVSNNLIVPKEKSVEWIGAQEVLEKPGDVL